MSRETAKSDDIAKPLLSHFQSIRVGVLSVFFALSITMMAHIHGRNRVETSLKTQPSFGKESEAGMRRLLSQSSGLDEDDYYSIGMSVKESRPVNDPEVIEVEKSFRKSFNELRRKNCASFKVYNIQGRIQFAKRSMGKAGLVQYDLEVVFGNETVFARISKGKRADKSSFELVSSVPAPCDDGVDDQMAISSAAVENINKQNLSWTAILNPEYEGLSVKTFGLGFLPLVDDKYRKHVLVDLMSQNEAPSPDIVGARTASTATNKKPSQSGMNRRAAGGDPSSTPANYTPPVAFDARDLYPGQTACKAYSPLDQGPCGACYAFSVATAFSARVCRARPDSVGNIVVSPQELVDCTNGCTGGDPLSVYGSLVTRPMVEQWCDPFTGVRAACGVVCGTSNTYSALPGSVRRIGGAGVYGVQQMQLELVRGGPGIVSFTVMNDLFAYSRGVYAPSSTASVVGGHAVSLIGWGVDQGVPYWLCQNSWGAGWGDSGFFRIVRGVDTCGIESSSGLVVAQPVVPAACPDANCSVASTTLSDCTCQCPFGRTGLDCADCALDCRNGGVAVAACTRCACPVGFYGRLCEGGYSLAPLASCASDPAGFVSVNFSFGGDVLPPTQASFIGVYQLAETGPFKALVTASVCGTTYDSSKNGGLCPSSGSFRMSRPTVPGRYKIAIAQYSPVDSRGLSGYYSLQDSNTISFYTVLPSDCSPESRTAAQLANDPATLLNNSLNAATAAEAAQQEAMKERLDSVQPLLTALLAEPEPTLTIDGLDPANPLVWMGIQGKICFRIPASANTNPKGLVLYVGNSTSYYARALGAGNSPMPLDYQGCSNFTVSKGVVVGKYIITLENSATGSVFAAVGFFADKASLACTAFSKATNFGTVTVAWTMPVARASVGDTVRVVNTRGTVVNWFYTSCKCQTAPGAIAVSSGSFAFRIVKPTVPGGYIFELHPGGLDPISAVAPNWIPWAKIGW